MKRVIQRNKHRHFTYPKIIHGQLNSDFELKLKRYKTYLPLADFLYELVETFAKNPEEPATANAKYNLIFHQAYQQQSNIGWENFFRGFISKHWKTVQHKYYIQINRIDIHAVDKWARMIIKTMLEFNRTMWKSRYNLIAEAKTVTYDERQRQDTIQLHQYLQQISEEVPDHAQHYLEQNEVFFQRSPIDNVLMWKRGVQASLDAPNPHKNGNLRRFFKRKKIP